MDFGHFFSSCFGFIFVSTFYFKVGGGRPHHCEGFSICISDFVVVFVFGVRKKR